MTGVAEQNVTRYHAPRERISLKHHFAFGSVRVGVLDLEVKLEE